jgi:hypothetical protein
MVFEEKRAEAMESPTHCFVPALYKAIVTGESVMRTVSVTLPIL